MISSFRRDSLFWKFSRRLSSLAYTSSLTSAAAELDHRLAINVVRALGPEAMRRAFTIENLGRLCQDCHRRRTRLDRSLARFLWACSLDWHRALRAW